MDSFSLKLCSATIDLKKKVHCQTSLEVYRNMFSVNTRVTLGRITFTILIQKSEKQWKVLRVCLENLPMGGLEKPDV